MIESYVAVQDRFPSLGSSEPRPTFKVLSGGLSHPSACSPVASLRVTGKHIAREVITVLFVSLLAGAVFAAGLGVIGGARGRYESARDHASRSATQIVQGDSLWSLACEHPIEGLGTADVCEIIRSWNDLGSATIQPGARLVVPAGPHDFHDVRASPDI
ncbi:Peptidoglycan-binding lysin domain protein [Coriobacterium glomerans PW2]|uniref:Peptidoglycan-binding lysin domain protein n=1 Tax=Coriobacterium glomerans (strain ATCC 49209 / DSM 20642 / JCM 10262 / PW2) TaxID=700015 RepID=F2N7X0_CORGP|nr:LysM peptidoglycan-binding domain-containing protein [Coriobacterium glomerans]AEB07079.1 Peptidoglycan-binding lysin domain protein [Coriobacterium glomerans PW2]